MHMRLFDSTMSKVYFRRKFGDLALLIAVIASLHLVLCTIIIGQDEFESVIKNTADELERSFLLRNPVVITGVMRHIDEQVTSISLNPRTETEKSSSFIYGLVEVESLLYAGIDLCEKNINLFRLENINGQPSHKCAISIICYTTFPKDIPPVGKRSIFILEFVPILNSFILTPLSQSQDKSRISELIERRKRFVSYAIGELVK